MNISNLVTSEIHGKTNKLLSHILRVCDARANEIAVTDNKGTYTYKHLLTAASGFAQKLRILKVQPGSIVALSMRKEFSYISSLLGCMINGNPFLPIDAGYPTERKNFMIEDAGAVLAAVNFDMCQQITNSITIIDATSVAPIESNIYSTPNDIIYNIYTSGTTGKPKCVPIYADALNNFIDIQGLALGVGSESVFASVASISFDMSIWEIFMTLSHGARIAMFDRDTIIDGRRLGKAFIDQRVSHVLMTPSMLSLLPNQNYPSMKCVVSAGEKCNSELVKFWSQHSTFYDAYGATEATIYTTLIKKTPETPLNCVGKPMDGSSLLIVDEDKNNLEHGVTGEIYIIGNAVSSGYYNRPELNKQKFLKINGKPAYATGDLGSLDNNGNLYFSGRKDRQIKFNGHRIEVEEIERQVNDTGMVLSCAVTLYSSPNGRSSLLLFLVPAHLNKYDSSMLRDQLRQFLPSFMMPSRIYEIQEIPTNTSGKTDFPKLLASITEEQL